MGEDTEQAAAHSRTCQGRGHGLAHADCSIRVIQLPSMRRSMSICIEYEATRPLSALVGRSASCTTPTLRQASHWPPRCRPGAHPKRLAGADPSPGLVWWPRRRRRWYSAKSASIMIDTDVHLYEYADRPGTSRLTWGGKLWLTRPRRQPGNRSDPRCCTDGGNWLGKANDIAGAARPWSF
jgi:hypothetical protein